MPNWCQNQLKIIGNEKQLAKLSKKLKTATAKKNFLQTLIPLPKELKNTQSPTSNKKDPKALNLLSKYGADNWYDWQIKNWGTKWDVELQEQHIDEYELLYTFDSAWSPPIEGLRKISELYPKLKFFINYEESGEGFQGVAKIENGTIDDKCFNY